MTENEKAATWVEWFSFDGDPNTPDMREPNNYILALENVYKDHKGEHQLILQTLHRALLHKDGNIVVHYLADFYAHHMAGDR